MGFPYALPLRLFYDGNWSGRQIGNQLWNYTPAVYLSCKFVKRYSEINGFVYGLLAEIDICYVSLSLNINWEI